MKPTVESVLEQLAKLGVRQGDVLFVTADLLRVGFFVKNRSETMQALVDLLRQAVGEQGTIVAAAYTPVFFRFKKDPRVLFSPDAPTTAGALPTALLSDPRSVRSRHPSNSCVAIGKEAMDILQAHDENSMCYSVLGQIVRRGGKHLMLGTIDRKNAPLGLHYAQELLGITKTEPTVGMFQSYYLDATDQRRLFTKWDVGGCSRGGYKMLGHLLLENAMTLGRVGNAPTALIDAEKSTSIAKIALSADRRAFICDDPWCLSCKGRWSVSGLSTPAFYFKKFALRRLFKTS
jgi:aminoglycoside 3-N-acetyltransferase